MESIILLVALGIGYIAIKSIYKNNKYQNKYNAKPEPQKTNIPKKNRYDELRNEYIKLHGIPTKDAVYKIDKHIDLLKRTYPGKPIDWYIEDFA